MTTMAAEANFSDLVNKPKDTLARLEGKRHLVLHRRDAEDLVLMTAEQAEQDTAVVRDTTRLFTEMFRRDPMVMAMAVQVLPSVFPWVRHLPDDEKKEFAAEWLDTLSAAADMNNNAAVETLVAGWRATAEVYADPELYEILTREHDKGDYGPVPPPPEVPE
ncbi:MAG: hypothetical protein J2P25_07200 [Nocardiopsaceae bacterium]|nr:hypothetical protein [Nocardiopsaceae bacterium]